MLRCETCKHKEVDGHEYPCKKCVECGVPYVEGTDEKLEDMYEEE